MNACLQINNYEEAYINRLDELILNLEESKECMEVMNKLNFCLQELKRNLPDNKKNLVLKADDLFMEILMIYEDYFYKNGYYDGGINK